MKLDVLAVSCAVSDTRFQVHSSSDIAICTFRALVLYSEQE